MLRKRGREKQGWWICLLRPPVFSDSPLSARERKGKHRFEEAPFYRSHDHSMRNGENLADSKSSLIGVLYECSQCSFIAQQEVRGWRV